MSVDKEIKAAFDTMGILVNSRIRKYGMENKKDEAIELENAYNIINKHFEDILVEENKDGRS